MTIKTFSIEYDAINSTNTFTNGDTINGRIILEVSKDTKLKSVFIGAEGFAYVPYGRVLERFYRFAHIILGDPKQGTEIIGQGRHIFPFAFKIHDGRISSSFKSSTCVIYHILRAGMMQEKKMRKVTETYFKFLSKADMDIPRLMEPQHGSKHKSVKTFGSGIISMDVHTQRMGYKQGEALEVTVEISNFSTHSVKPKFILYEKQSFLTAQYRRIPRKKIIKEETEAVASSRKVVVTKLITIPRDLTPSIFNCLIFKLEYRLKVYLDIKCAPNLEIKLPIVVLPSFETPAMRRPSATAAAGFGFESWESGPSMLEHNITTTSSTPT